MKEITKERLQQGECLFLIIPKTSKKDRTDEIIYANKIGKPVYMLIEDGADNPTTHIDNFLIRKKFYTMIITKPLIDWIFRDIFEDLQFFKASGGITTNVTL